MSLQSGAFPSGQLASLVDEPIDLSPRPQPVPAEEGWPDPSLGRRRERVRVLICDNHEIYRLGLRALIGAAPDLVLVAEADDPGHALRLAFENAPDVALISQDLHGDGTLELIRRLSPYETGVVVLADSGEENDLLDALRAGARGYLTRRTPPQLLLDGIRAVARNETALDSNVAGQLVHHLDMAGAAPAPAPKEAQPFTRLLTARQRAVAELVADGLSNAEIARRLYLSQATVKSHLTIILRRLNLRDRTQLAILVNRGATLGSP